MRGLQPQGHVTLHYCAYVTSQKRYISTFARSMDPKPSTMVSTIREPHLQSHVTHHSLDHLTNQKSFVSTLTKAHGHPKTW